ncbi:MAG: glycosyltransferase [Lentisphaeria bacterium]|nr:MAG: glycosyltransferase [Lentisphaeria bacterium]
MVKRSVALAAFRGGEFLAAQLDSILNQSLPPDEIILSDDSPDEATRQAVAPQLAAHPEIRYVRNPVPLGPDRNFEQAISMTTGDLIFLADQDDVWLPRTDGCTYRPTA